MFSISLNFNPKIICSFLHFLVLSFSFSIIFLRNIIFLFLVFLLLVHHHFLLPLNLSILFFFFNFICTIISRFPCFFSSFFCFLFDVLPLFILLIHLLFFRFLHLIQLFPFFFISRSIPPPPFFSCFTSSLRFSFNFSSSLPAWCVSFFLLRHLIISLFFSLASASRFVSPFPLRLFLHSLPWHLLSSFFSTYFFAFSSVYSRLHSLFDASP